ncbi:MAG: transcription elongation factor GreA [Anaerolinea sp.]|nr:transcription elongation factor GreA [Anaerolinea sp.]MCC6973934.1 transcription elongation factor GreA [Anaerolineae bacterium]CAG0999492.1 Transcription elongation factor GreA [Anaerolineae bacterium]
MSDQIHYLTKQGLEDLEARLEYLRNVRRAEVAERLHQALEEGGELVENAEYEDAKAEQAFLEGEIMRLENILSNAQIIEQDADKATVSLGDHVLVQEKGKRTKETYHIVGAAEADPRNGRISNESPMGRALLGKKVGEKVTVKAPDGDIVFVIKSIE